MIDLNQADINAKLAKDANRPLEIYPDDALTLTAALREAVAELENQRTNIKFVNKESIDKTLASIKAKVSL